MNRKDCSSHKFGNWSPYREIYQNYYCKLGIAGEIHFAYWGNKDTDPSRYSLWDYTH